MSGRTHPAPGPREAPGLELDDYLPYRLSVAANEVSRLISRAYQQRFGLSIPQWRLTALLAETPGATPQALAARTAMDKVAVSRAAGELVAAGLARRRPHAHDRRSHVLDLTPAGLDLYAAVAPAARALEAELLSDWRGDEIAEMKARLQRLEQAARARLG